MTSAKAFAKINLGLVVGPLRPDGKHEVVTVLHAVDLHDTVEVEPTSSSEIVVEGFEDTIVRRALSELADVSGERGWKVTIEKRIPVAAGLGGGSSDAAAALRLANELIGAPLSPSGLSAVAAELGSDVPFFLEEGPRLATKDGSELSPVRLPLGFWVVLVLPFDATKASTAAIYEAFDARGGADGFEARRDAFLSALEDIRGVTDLAALPGNDLASSPVAEQLVALGAFRADVSGAGPTVYGLFEDEPHAERAARALDARGQTWLVRPATVS